MAIPKPCIVCGDPTPVGNRCPRHQAQWQAKRNASPKRQGYKDPVYRAFPKYGCAICGGTEFLEKHHIDKNTSNNSDTNLRVLCRTCHHALHKSDFQQLLNRNLGTLAKKTSKL